MTEAHDRQVEGSQPIMYYGNEVERLERSERAGRSTIVGYSLGAIGNGAHQRHTAAGLPCGGALIVDLQPGQLAMLLGKIERLAAEKGGTWTTLLAALQSERATRLARGRRRPVRVAGPATGAAAGEG
jgi:hypothetical protein